jgi:uncharacterized membrane protein
LKAKPYSSQRESETRKAGSDKRRSATGSERKPSRVVNLTRLEALGDAIFAFSLTLLALDLRLPDVLPQALASGFIELLPRLLIFALAFLVIAHQWDVHQRTMMQIVRVDGLMVWLCLVPLMFVVLMPATADALGRYPLQPLALTFFGINAALLNLTSWAMWRHAARTVGLLDEEIDDHAVLLVGRLWLVPAIIIILTIPLAFVCVYPAYVIWALLPVTGYVYGNRALGRH